MSKKEISTQKCSKKIVHVWGLTVADVEFDKVVPGCAYHGKT